MRISELSAATDVPVATIKYYIRAGLLPEGRPTAPRQADYSETHVARLRLIRALLGPGGLSVARAAAVLSQLDDPPESVHDFLGAAHHALGAAQPEQGSHPRADAVLAELGWEVDPADHEARSRLEQALAGLEDAGFPLAPELLQTYAAAMHGVAAREVQGVPLDSPAEALRYVVLGTVLIEPVLLALRRLAQQDVSGRLFARAGSPGPAPDPGAPAA
ncbi:MerR family transcriptional regulator [Arthrobacter sp. NPDC055585]